MERQAGKVKTPISVTSPDNVPVVGCGKLRGRGFTLLELLVVIAIAAILVAVVPASFIRLREVSQYRDTVRSIVVNLRQARQQAVSYGYPVTYRIDLPARQLGIEGRSKYKLPDAVEIKATVGNSGVAESAGIADIVFLPDGGATGGTIELVRQSGSGVRIRVDWLLGQVTQEPR